MAHGWIAGVLNSLAINYQGLQIINNLTEWRICGSDISMLCIANRHYLLELNECFKYIFRGYAKKIQEWYYGRLLVCNFWSRETTSSYIYNFYYLCMFYVIDVVNLV